MAGTLKILAVTLRYPPYVAGGYELITAEVVESLRGHGHEVHVLTGRGARFSDEGVLPELMPELDGEDPLQRSLSATNPESFRLHFLRLANYRATLRALDRGAYDVLFFFNLGLVSLGPLLAARHHGTPSLGYLADPWPSNLWLSAWDGSESGRRKAWQRDFLRRSWEGFRGLVGLGPLCACSRYLAREMEHAGVPAESLSVVAPGLPPDIPGVQPGAEPRRAVGEALRVVCASSLWEGKGQHVLIDALAAARTRGRIRLALLGTGAPAYESALRSRVSRAGLDGEVEFLGAVPRGEVPAQLSRSHVLAMPSVWGEPFGRTTVEGMAHGLAILASDAGASPEIVRDGKDGLVVSAGDVLALARGLERLEADEPERLRLGQAARERVRTDFDHGHFVECLEQALRRALGERVA